MARGGVFRLRCQPRVRFSFPGLALGETETADPVIDLSYRYTPARKAYTPRGEYGPIDPPEPAEVELIGAWLVDGDGLVPNHGQVEEWALEWLDGEGYEEAVSWAQEFMGPDPDEAYERRRDDSFT